MPPASRYLIIIDFGDLSKFRSTIWEDKAKLIRRRYPFRQGYDLNVPELNDRAHLPPDDLTIYIDQLEAGFRMLTSRFLRDNLRYWGTRITQLTSNAIRVLVGFELVCSLLSINPIVNLFCRFHTIKKHNNSRGWFYINLRFGSVKLIDDMLMSIEHWKEHFIFVSDVDFSRVFGDYL